MANTYGKVSGTFQEIDNAYGKVSGVWKEAEEIYGVQKDNRIIEYVQKGMIDAGLRVKVPVKKFKRF